MVEIIVALLATTGVLGAAGITGWVTLKINRATKRADENTSRADAIFETMWVKVDRLQTDKRSLERENDRLKRELQMCHEQRER